jgi:hypothetical protein
MELPKSWNAFELTVLRRLKFRSVAIPFTGNPALYVHIKRWGCRVATNDISRASWYQAVARIENNTERLTEADIETVLDDAYVPHHKLNNPSLRTWFSETDAWWFQNVRENVEKLPSPMRRAVALAFGMMVGDYVFSFNEQTLELRQPLSKVFKRLWENEPIPVNNGLNNTAANREARDFLAEQRTDLLYLRLPKPTNSRQQQSRWAWSEEWIRGEGNFWEHLERAQAGKLGAPIETKSQYLRMVESLLETAAHIPLWAIFHVENGFVSGDEIVDTISRIRRVDTIYTKDFSEMLGTRAVLITAGSKD